LTRVLVICEKPTAAERIAEVIDEKGRPEPYRESGVPYFLAHRGNALFVVVPALGHLFSVTQTQGSWTYPVFDIKWVPAYAIDKESRTKNFVEAIQKLSQGVDSYISACDYDTEGSLIAYTILRYICGEDSIRRAQRMKFSTLTKKDLQEAFDGMMPTLDFPVIYAGKARHEVDFLFGINLSRALMLSLKHATGRYKTLSIGRVQGPTLHFIKDREVEIRTFVPEPYWIIEAEAIIDGQKYPLEYSKPRVSNKNELNKILDDCRGKPGTIKGIVARTTSQAAPAPFNLGDLQREAYNLFRYSPRTTLSITEQLYLAALISYPRTSSQRIPPTIDIRTIVRDLARKADYSELAGKLLAKPELKPRQGEKDDPAHPAIHPTGNIPEERLNQAQSRIFDLIVRRFFASLADASVFTSIKVDVEVGSHLFYLRGRQTKHLGWIEFYGPYLRREDMLLPALQVGRDITVTRLEGLERFTSPPPRFNPSSILKLMEDSEIGTKATRSDIIDTLFKRGYIQDESVTMTDLGFVIVDTFEKYCPEVLSVEMTRALESDMELILLEKRVPEEVVAEAVETLKPILKGFKDKEALVGGMLNAALRTSEVKENELGLCPECKTGTIRVIRSRSTGKRFAGCSNYLKTGCKTTYSLPQAGKIEATGRSCPACGAPVIRVSAEGRRPLSRCVNMSCPSKKGR